MKKNQDQQLENLRHSLAHLLAAAVMKLWPGTKRAIGPAIENGFYFDFEFTKPITDADLSNIEKKMRDILPTWTTFTRHLLTADRARKEYQKNPYKHELIKEFSKDGKKVSFYKSGSYWDLCKGGHVDNMNMVDPHSFKLTHIAGAYWRGSEKNKMLTRIYGVAFPTKKELEHYLWQQEETKKRDHRKLGQELDLFTFSELVGPGLPLFTPKGTIIRDLLDDFVWMLRQKHSRGNYQKVDIPHITKKDLYEQSGHWGKFENELFRITTREGHEFALKPMNCPHHIEIFARKKWSFRDLPQRYASTTKIYRDEQTGELSGLTRVRSITQDDAHIFCNMDKVESELEDVWEVIHEFYNAFNLPLKLRLSLCDPKQPKNYLGDQKVWEGAENTLRMVAKRKGGEYFEAKGEAAFYGPKLDFMATDSLGREWQVATIQLDLNMPKCFNLTFTNTDGGQSNIYIIHAAIMGSIERLLAILIEHYAGAFPLWLAPVQIAILTINDAVRKYAEDVKEKLAGWRIQLNDENETIGKKIRDAELQKIPYILVVGKKEAETKTVAVRERGKGDRGQMTVDKLKEILK